MEITNVLIDTGSAGTLLSADAVADIGIFVEGPDQLIQIFGVGGTEQVFSRIVDSVEIGGHSIVGFKIEVGAMDYGFDINGIIGMDLLTRLGAILNLREMTIEFAN